MFKQVNDYMRSFTKHELIEAWDDIEKLKNGGGSVDENAMIQKIKENLRQIWYSDCSIDFAINLVLEEMARRYIEE